MKRWMVPRPFEPAALTRTIFSIPAMGVDWNALTLPEVPAADWPASLLLDHAIDRIVREAIGSGGSLQEAVASVRELARSIVPQLTDAEIDVRVHAQVLANT